MVDEVRRQSSEDELLQAKRVVQPSAKASALITAPKAYKLKKVRVELVRVCISSPNQ